MTYFFPNIVCKIRNYVIHGVSYECHSLVLGYIYISREYGQNKTSPASGAICASLIFIFASKFGLEGKFCPKHQFLYFPSKTKYESPFSQFFGFFTCLVRFLQYWKTGNVEGNFMFALFKSSGYEQSLKIKRTKI